MNLRIREFITLFHLYIKNGSNFRIPFPNTDPTGGTDPTDGTDPTGGTDPTNGTNPTGGGGTDNGGDDYDPNGK